METVFINTTMNISQDLSDNTSIVTINTDPTMTVTEEPGRFVHYNIPFFSYFQVYGAFIVSVSSVGIVGNILAMIVLSQKDMSSVGTQLLFHLAIPDTVYLLTIILLDGIIWLHPSVQLVDHVAIASQSFLAPISHTVFTTSIYLTMALAIQRYFLVARPLEVQAKLTKMSIRVVVAAVYVFAIIYNIPHWIAYVPETYWEPYLNRTWIQPKNQDFLLKSPFYNVYYKVYFNFIVKFIIPFAVLLGTTVAILVAMSRREFKNTNKGLKAGNRMTLIVLAVTVMSLLSHATTSTQWVLRQFPWKGKGCKMTCVIFGRIGNAMVVCNCVFNFVFYCTFGRKFRKTLYSLFHRRSLTSVVHEES